MEVVDLYMTHDKEGKSSGREQRGGKQPKITMYGKKERKIEHQ